MITSLHISKHNPWDGGFRYTHDVIWHGTIVGEATAVSRLKDGQFTWYAFVRFIASVQALQAVASNDTEPTTTYFEALPGGRRCDYDPKTITAQSVYLRGVCHNGGYHLAEKVQPVPIPGVRPPMNEEELAEMKADHPEVSTW